MQAIILAAGMGKRLKNLTSDRTKCMVEVNGIPLIKRMLFQLEEINVERIIIVTGYQSDSLKKYIKSLEIKTPVIYINNEIYNKTNNIYSLSLAKKYLLEKDTILLESDLIFETNLLKLLVEDPRETLALVDKYESWMDGTVVKLSDDDEITAFIPGKKFVFDDIPQYYKTVNIYKFSRQFSKSQYIPFLEAYIKTQGNNEYYEQVLNIVTFFDNCMIRAKRVQGLKWYEIDDIQDLDIAASIFIEDDKKLEALMKRYGGYWRYPKLLDFCYLVNPYYPPARMIEEIKANADKLITNYPSGADVNALLAAKNFSVRNDFIAVGNGASEMIKSVIENHKSKIGFIRPTFEEYPNRCKLADNVDFFPENDNFTYNAEDLISFFNDKNISMLILINPDNPSGNYIKKNEVVRLLVWCKEKQITLLLDESFIDFSDEKDCSLIKESILLEYQNLIIVKSISKSYGIPGLRLGVIVCGNKNIIDRVKRDISIWNINSLAEFYMQIAEKYDNDYIEALELFRQARLKLINELNTIKFIRAIPSQANYIMCELTEKFTAQQLAQKLLAEYNILIKDLTGKLNTTKQYVRIAVRSTEDNNNLICALKEL